MNFDFNKKFEQMMTGNKIDHVIILGHMNPDGDAAGSVLGLSHYIKDVYPEYTVRPYLAETLDKGPKKLVETDQTFHPFQKPDVSGRYAVIVCDTANEARMIGKDLYENAVVTMVIDHHASNKKYADINYVRISEACAENVFHILDWERWAQKKSIENLVHPAAPDYIYMGILHDTSCFTRACDTIFHAAAGLLQMGVKHNYVMTTMKAATFEDEKRRSLLFSMTKREYHGKIAYVMLGRNEIETYGITYEDIHPFSGILRDCEDIELGITMYEEEPGCWRCSFRSDGKWLNLNELLAPFGGGGHAAAAGLRKFTDDPEKLKNDIFLAVEKIRNDHIFSL